MPKKHKHEEYGNESLDTTEQLPVPEGLSEVVEYTNKLADIRAKSIKTQVHTAHTIAELEALRADIDATLAVLRSQRKG
jgi:hypothetical protein